MSKKTTMYHIDQGHARFSSGHHSGGCFYVAAYSSDQKVDPASYNHKEINEILTPVYALSFDSVEHFADYVTAMQRILKNAKQSQENA